MEWVKKGVIFKVENNHEWMLTHAQNPVAHKLSDETLRIYFATRDIKIHSRPTFIEVNPNNLQEIKYVHDKPVLELGELGSFDESGVVPNSVVTNKGIKYLYYTGWNVSRSDTINNAIGMAVSEDGGLTFKRAFRGPVVGRYHLEPFFAVVPHVRIENGIWRMWYSTCVEWKVFNNKPESRYHIRYAESKDGFNWTRKQIVCIDFKDENEAGVAKPTILHEGGLYKMWFSYRGMRYYRTDKKESYRIGYAESRDGISWTRMDEKAGIDVSDEGWDSQMIAYPEVFRHKNNCYLLYNGNGFGTSGLGYAVMSES